MTESIKSGEKCKIKFKKLTDMKTSLSKKRRRSLDVHNEIKNEDCIFCDDIVCEKKSKAVVKRNMPLGYPLKGNKGNEHSQYLAVISDEESSPYNVLHHEVEVRDGLKGAKRNATPLKTKENYNKVLNATNKADEIHIATEKKSNFSKHKNKLKQKNCLKQLKRNTLPNIKFLKKFGKCRRKSEPLKVTTVDENLPYGWKKSAVQRKGGSSVGKWDVFYISPQGRKFRSKNELISYLKETDEMYQTSKFDFSFNQPKIRDKPVKIDHRTEEATSQRHLSSVSNDTQNTSFGSEPPKRIKTLLPKIRAQEEEIEIKQMHIVKSEEPCESGFGNEDHLATTLEIKPQLECHNSLSSSSVLQPGQESSSSATSFMPISKTDSESGETWITFGVPAEESCQYTDGAKHTTCIKNNLSKEVDIPSMPSEYDTTNIEDTRTEEFLGQEPIRCLCGMAEEEGLMIQCDVCQCWQHALCNDIVHQDDVPQHFICCFCHHPNTEQQCVKHFDDQDWLYKGQLPSLSFVKKDPEMSAKCEATLAAAHHLLAELCYVKEFLHCLRVKTTVAQTPNHPKLILWNKYKTNEEQQDNDVVVDVLGTHNGFKDYPQPEAAIDFNICQKKLLEHLQESHHDVEKKLNDIEEKFQGLEKEFISSGYGTSETNIQNAIKSMLEDLEKIFMMCKYL